MESKESRKEQSRDDQVGDSSTSTPDPIPSTPGAPTRRVPTYLPELTNIHHFEYTNGPITAFMEVLPYTPPHRAGCPYLDPILAIC